MKLRKPSVCTLIQSPYSCYQTWVFFKSQSTHALAEWSHRLYFMFPRNILKAKIIYHKAKSTSLVPVKGLSRLLK